MISKVNKSAGNGVINNNENEIKNNKKKILIQ